MLTFNRFIQLGFWLLAFPFILLFCCFAFGFFELIRFIFPYLILLGLAFQFLGDRDTPTMAAPFILSVLLLQSVIYGSVILMARSKLRTIAILSGVHVAVYLTTVFLTWWYAQR